MRWRSTLLRQCRICSPTSTQSCGTPGNLEPVASLNLMSTVLSAAAYLPGLDGTKQLQMRLHHTREEHKGKINMLIQQLNNVEQKHLLNQMREITLPEKPTKKQRQPAGPYKIQTETYRTGNGSEKKVAKWVRFNFKKIGARVITLAPIQIECPQQIQISSFCSEDLVHFQISFKIFSTGNMYLT